MPPRRFRPGGLNVSAESRSLDQGPRLVSPASRLSRLLFACLVLWAAPSARAFAEEVEILPHRAIYRMELSALRGAGSVVDVSGRMDFEWRDTCDAWTVSQRMRILVGYEDGNQVDFGLTLNTWESKDGLNYRFFIRHLYAGRASEEIRGKAQLEATRNSGQASFAQPEKKRVPLPSGTLFPVEHTQVLIDAMRRDAMPLWRTVFDGSGEIGLFGISAALVKALPPEPSVSEGLEAIKDQPSWRLRLAFFDLGGPEAAEPEQEQALRIYANGVVDELVLDFPEFSVRAILEELEPLATPGC